MDKWIDGVVEKTRRPRMQELWTTYVKLVAREKRMDGWTDNFKAAFSIVHLAITKQPPTMKASTTDPEGALQLCFDHLTASKCPFVVDRKTIVVGKTVIEFS